MTLPGGCVDSHAYQPDLLGICCDAQIAIQRGQGQLPA